MSTTPNILLVEDDEQIANMIMYTFQHAGLPAAHVDNGRAAIEFLDEWKPDLIVLDLMLPEVSGWQVLEYAQGKYGNDVKVIVTTARSDPANKLTGKLHLVAKYMVKPFNPQDLVTTIRDFFPEDA
jgi:DNA-binding response OmpR family regulator